MRDKLGRFKKGNIPHNKSKTKNKQIIICTICGKKFEVFLCRKNTAKFCSYKCAGIGRRGVEPPNKNQQRKTCKTCGKEFFVKLSRIHKAKYCSRNCQWESFEWKNNIGLSNKGKKRSLESRQKMKKAKLKKPTKYWLGKKLPKYMIENCKRAGIKAGKIIKKQRKGKTLEEIFGKEKGQKMKELNRITTKKLWETPEWREKIIKAILSGERPTSLEKKYIQFFKNYNIPFKYCGNGSLLVGYKNPDFEENNGRKLCIEVANKKEKSIKRSNKSFDSWQEYEKQRIEHFAKHGWKCLVLWQEELKTPEKIVEKIKNFMEIRNEKDDNSLHSDELVDNSISKVLGP